MHEIGYNSGVTLVSAGVIDLRGATSEAATSFARIEGEPAAGSYRRVMRVHLGGNSQTDSLGAASAAIAEAGVREAREKRLPVILSIRAAGVSVEEGLGASIAWSRVAREMVKSSGVIPLLAAAAGPVTSGPALLLGLADISVFTADASAYVSGPLMVEQFTGVPVDADTLGGPGRHAQRTGLASTVVSTLEEGIADLVEILSFLPDHVDTLPPTMPNDDPPSRTTPEITDLIPTTATGSYDVRDVIAQLSDHGEFTEVRAEWAPNLVTGFASLGGIPVGIVANQTQALAGSIDIPASHKGARFVGLCDAFNVCLLTLVDTSGFLPGKDLEWRGMIRHGAQLAFSYARATVPRVGLILRKSYGGAYIVMDSKNMGNDLMIAWPSAEVAVMGAKGAVEILHRNVTPDERAEARG